MQSFETLSTVFSIDLSGDKPLHTEGWSLLAGRRTGLVEGQAHSPPQTSQARSEGKRQVDKKSMRLIWSWPGVHALCGAFGWPALGLCRPWEGQHGSSGDARACSSHSRALAGYRRRGEAPDWFLLRTVFVVDSCLVCGCLVAWGRVGVIRGPWLRRNIDSN